MFSLRVCLLYSKYTICTFIILMDTPNCVTWWLCELVDLVWIGMNNFRSNYFILNKPFARVDLWGHFMMQFLHKLCTHCTYFHHAFCKSVSMNPFSCVRCYIWMERDYQLCFGFIHLFYRWRGTGNLLLFLLSDSNS